MTLGNYRMCKVFVTGLILRIGQACYIALRWSAKEGDCPFYRHIAPLEQRGFFTTKGFFTPAA